MTQPVFSFDDVLVSSDSPRFNELVAAFYLHRKRPLCICTKAGVPMYIAKVNDTYVLKRMPNSGDQHSPECGSFEPPAELTGMGQVLGTAIQEDADSGLTLLRLDFALSKAPGKRIPHDSAIEHDSVAAKENKLSLRGTLHYLWGEAGFNRWYPAMANKRNWYVIRKHLLEAADKTTAKKSNLADILLIPEVFVPDNKVELEQRRLAKMEPFRAKATTGARHLMLLIGEVKAFGEARFGNKMIIKHLPDFPFYMDEALFKAMDKRFSNELELWLEDRRHLVSIATFGIGQSGTAQVEEISLMLVNENWIPADTLYELSLIDRLTKENRRFIKGLRYNLPSKTPIATAVLTDTEPKATALYIQPSDDKENEAQATLIVNSHLDTWIWTLGDKTVPPLPSPAAHHYNNG